MIPADLHVHTSFSADSKTPMEEQVKAAIRAGLTVLCFTEHEDLDHPYDNTPEEERGDLFRIPLSAYRREYERLRTKYEGQIRLLFGCELGLAQERPDLFGAITAYPESAPFDFVIGSTHSVHRLDPYYSDYFAEGIEKGVADYFTQSLRNVETYDCFDSYGHLDYVLRYAWKALPEEERYQYGAQNRDFGEEEYEKNQDTIDRILKVLVEKDRALEVNTQGLSKGYPETNPCAAIVRRFRELGGTKITVGTDAHTPDLVGTGYAQAEEVLKTAGFTGIFIFEQRKGHQISL